MNEDSNYGINILTKDKIETITTYTQGIDAGYWGPVIEKNGNYYITALKEGTDIMDLYNASINGTYNYEDYYSVALVIDKSMSPDEAVSIINKWDRTPTKANCNIDKMDEYIREVESATGKEVQYVNFEQDSDKIDIRLVDTSGNKSEANGIEIIESNNANTKYDVNNVLEQVGRVKKYYSNEKIDDENKEIIEEYLNRLTNSNNFSIVKNSEGNYVLVQKVISNTDGKEDIQNQVLLSFDDTTTLGEAVYQINARFIDEKSLDNMNKSNKSNKVQNKSNGGRIYIDVNAFNRVSSADNNAIDILNGCKGKYNISMLTDELKKAHNSLVSENPMNKITNIVGMITSLNSNIKYSLKTYDNIDHNLGVIINSVISEIFSMNSYKDKETQQFYESSLEDREKNLGKMIENLSTQIDNLKLDYEKKYPNGLVNLDESVSNLVMGVANAFNFIGDDAIKDNGIPGLSLLNTIDFIQQNNCIDKMDNYASGDDWQKSGLAKIYYERLGVSSKYFDEFGDYGHLIQETEFLGKYMKCQKFDYGTQLQWIQTQLENSPGIPLDDEYYGNEKNEIKKFMKSQIDQLKNYQNSVVIDEETGKTETLSSLDLIKYYAQDCVASEEAISTAENTKSNYEKYKKIMPFEADMNGETYLEYLVHDWSKEDLSEILGEDVRYMSQSEIALYCMYKGFSLTDKVNPNAITGINQDEKAEGYLAAMSDLINQRHGLEEALDRFEAYQNWVQNEGVTGGIKAFLKSGLLDGFSDGIEGFFDGITNCLMSDGEKSYRDYRDMYMLSLFDSNGASALDIDIDMNPTLRSLLRRNYSVFKSVGTMTIPTLASFVGLGNVSSLLYTANAFGSSMEMAKQNGSDAVHAYLYSGVSALSNLALTKLMGGIRGLNGNVAPVKGVVESIQGMAKQGVRAAVGVWVDTTWRSAILGQPIDLSGETMLDAAINGILTSAVMNGISSVSIKIADGFVAHFSDTYNSYQEMLQNNATPSLMQQFKKSELYNKLRMAFGLGDKKVQKKYDTSIVGKWMKESGKDNRYGITDKTAEAEKILNFDKINLKPGEKLIFDADRHSYYIYNENTGSALAIPNSFLNTREGNMHITPTAEEKLGLTLKTIGIIDKDSISDLGKALNYIKDSSKSPIEKRDALNASLRIMLEGINSDKAKAVKIYSELTRILHYDEGFIQNSDSSRLKSDVNLLNLNDKNNSNDVICTEFSTIYEDLLIRAGFDPSKVHEVQPRGVHMWIQVDLDDGGVLVADATDNVGGRTDLTSSKAGLGFVGLGIFGPEYKDRSISMRLLNEKAVKYTNDTAERDFARQLLQTGYDNIKDVYSEIGALNIGEYDVVASLVKDSDQLSMSQKVTIINDIKDNVDMTPLEWLHTSRKLFDRNEIVESRYDGESARSFVEIKDTSVDPPVRYKIEINGSKDVQIYTREEAVIIDLENTAEVPVINNN